MPNVFLILFILMVKVHSCYITNNFENTTILIGQDIIIIPHVGNGILLICTSTSLPVSCAHADFLHKQPSLNVLLIIYIDKTAALFQDILENERHTVNEIRF